MNITAKSILLKRLENAISKSDFKDMEIALPIAEEYKVSKIIIKKVAVKIADHHLTKKRFDQAIIFYNKARSIDPTIKKIFELFCRSVTEFYEHNIDEFSKKDLEEFKQAIIPAIDFHKYKFPAHRKVVVEIEELVKRIDYRKKYAAKEMEESRVSYRILQIKNALYSDMTIEEVRKEFAKLISIPIRKILTEKEKKIDSQSKDKAKEKPEKSKKKKKK